MAKNGARQRASVLEEILDREHCEVFISHRSNPDDLRFAMGLEKKLIEKGIDCFLDVDNIECGESFAQRILDGIKRSRLVVVFFTEAMSTWIHFEASCAFFDKKLFPVSLDGVEVPRPYSRVHYHSVASNLGDEQRVEEEIDKLVALIERKLHGAPKNEKGTRIFRALNSFFFSGLNIFCVLIATALVLRGGDYREHFNHLHITLGSVILGGQFFLSLGFARTVASTGYLQREHGFNTAEKLFWIWTVLAVIQPAVGIGLALHSGSIPDWVWLSLCVYLAALFSTWIGYTMAKGAHDLEAQAGQPYKISKRYFFANLMLMLGFILMVAVLNLMIARPSIG